MTSDPIVKEVRAAGEELARRAGFDMDRLCEMLREQQRQQGIKGVDRSARRSCRYPVGQLGKAVAVAESGE